MPLTWSLKVLSPLTLIMNAVARAPSNTSGVAVDKSLRSSLE